MTVCIGLELMGDRGRAWEDELCTARHPCKHAIGLEKSRPSGKRCNRGYAMYAVSRRYKTTASFEEINKKVSDGLVPLIKKIKGFRAYRTVNLGGGYVASFSLFDDKSAADEATRKAREWITSDPSLKKLLPDAPEVAGGEVGLNINA
jgi:hypothetical protein